LKREAAEKRAKERAAGGANDNEPRAPDGYIDTGDGRPMAYWLPQDAKPRDTA
jgi:hypothetical protein